MKYICELQINKPLEQVLALWKNPEHYPRWQDGFESKKTIEGKHLEPGSKAELVFLQGGRRMELLETVLEENLPEYFAAQYDHKHMTNTQITRFIALNGNTTKYLTEVEYTAFHSFMPRVMASLFPSMFRKQSEKWMNQFKAFVEEYGDLGPS